MRQKWLDAMKAEGWEFASHTWGHMNAAERSAEDLKTDDEKMEEICSPDTWRYRYDHLCVWCRYRELGRLLV